MDIRYRTAGPDRLGRSDAEIFVYDPKEHDGAAFSDLPDDWKCPRCRQPKEKFNKA